MSRVQQVIGQRVKLLLTFRVCLVWMHVHFRQCAKFFKNVPPPTGSLPALKTREEGSISQPSKIIIHLRKQVSDQPPQRWTLSLSGTHTHTHTHSLNRWELDPKASQHLNQELHPLKTGEGFSLKQFISRCLVDCERDVKTAVLIAFMKIFKHKDFYFKK